MPTNSFQCIGILWILEQFKTPVDFVPPLKVSIKIMKFTFDLFSSQTQKESEKRTNGLLFSLEQGGNLLNQKGIIKIRTKANKLILELKKNKCKQSIYEVHIVFNIWFYKELANKLMNVLFHERTSSETTDEKNDG